MPLNKTQKHALKRGINNGERVRQQYGKNEKQG